MTLISQENRNSNVYRNSTYFGVSLKDLWFLISRIQLFTFGKSTRILVFTVNILLRCRQHLYRYQYHWHHDCLSPTNYLELLSNITVDIVQTKGPGLIYVIYVGLRIVVSNTYRVDFLLCFSSSVVPDVTSFSRLSFLIDHSIFSIVYFIFLLSYHAAKFQIYTEAFMCQNYACVTFFHILT